MRLRQSAALIIAWLAFGQAALAYDKATEGNEVVMDKLFPKKNKVELDLRLGKFLNGSYIDTYLVNGTLSYFWSESWGFSLEGNFMLNTDAADNPRGCIETFYNDPNYAVQGICKSQGGSLGDDAAGDATYGPAYVPIRQVDYIFTANFVWNPIYGKQIVMLSATNYFDIYVAMGGGLAMSHYYPEQQLLPDGRASRGSSTVQICLKKDAAAKKCDPSKNPGTTDSNLIGEAGRPMALSETSPLIHLAIGQRFHFLKRFELSASLDNYTLLGTAQGFDNFLALMGGLGVRF